MPKEKKGNGLIESLVLKALPLKLFSICHFSENLCFSRWWFGFFKPFK